MNPQQLAPYATHESARDAARNTEEPGPGLRGEFQRDRDRVIHSTAFRRLEYKTQVFVNHEGDLFRTRLTHSMEVAQIARTVARALTLNEDLTEAICLAHDLGHTPFGHAGQDALNSCMAEHGGFEHNLQSLRIVDQLEEKYAAFSGLNLSFATREGILKHCSVANAGRLGLRGRRFLEGHQPSLEAQLANVCDEIAYNNHDVDDGLRAGLLDLEQLEATSLAAEALTQVRQQWPDLARRRVIHEMVRRMIDAQVRDLVATTRSRILAHGPGHVDEIRALGTPMAGLSAPMLEQHLQLKRFLRPNLYQHVRVHRMTTKARTVVRELFDAFSQDSRLLPKDVRQRMANGSGEEPPARAIADYIAGMTDRFAIAEHRRVFDPQALS